MKRFTFVFILLCGAIAGAIVYLNWQKAAPVVQAASDQTMKQAQPERIVTPKPKHPQMISTNAEETAQPPLTTPIANEANSDDSTNSISKAVDALLSAKNGGQKHALFQQLAQSGELRADGCNLALHRGKLPPGERSPSPVKIVFAVSNVRDAVKQFAANGLKFGEVHEWNGISYADTKDPEGNPIQISSRGEA